MNGHTLPDYQNRVSPPFIPDEEGGACEFCGASGSDVKLFVVYGREVCGRCRGEARRVERDIKVAAARPAKKRLIGRGDKERNAPPAPPEENTCPECGLPFYSDELADLFDPADIAPGGNGERASDFGIVGAAPWCQCGFAPCAAYHVEERDIPRRALALLPPKYEQVGGRPCPREIKAGYLGDTRPQAGKCDGCRFLREVVLADGEQGPEFDCLLNSCELCRAGNGGRCEREEQTGPFVEVIIAEEVDLTRYFK